MTIPKKTLLSFLFSVFLFSCIFLIAYPGFFNVIENRFYKPSVTAAVIRETARDAEIIDDFLSSLQKRFSSLLRENSIRRSFLAENNSADIFERSRIFGSLMETIPGLNSICFVDLNGVDIHYSVFHSDDGIEDLPFNEIYVPAHEQYKLNYHKERNELIFSFSFYDSTDYRVGIALFAISVNEIFDALAAAGKIGYNDKLIFCSSGTGSSLAGIIKAYPGISEKNITSEAVLVWAGKYQSIVSVRMTGIPLVLVTVPSEYNFWFSRIVREDMLLLPDILSIITLISIFLTIFLIVFFVFNIIQNRTEKNKPDAAGKKPMDLEELESITDKDSIEKNVLPSGSILVPLDETNDMIYEQNGVPYIKNDVLENKENTDEKLNDDFMELIDSVTDKQN